MRLKSQLHRFFSCEHIIFICWEEDFQFYSWAWSTSYQKNKAACTSHVWSAHSLPLQAAFSFLTLLPKPILGKKKKQKNMKMQKTNPHSGWHAVSEWSGCLPVQVMDCDTASLRKCKVHGKNRVEKKKGYLVFNWLLFITRTSSAWQEGGIRLI